MSPDSLGDFRPIHCAAPDPVARVELWMSCRHCDLEKRCFVKRLWQIREKKKKNEVFLGRNGTVFLVKSTADAREVIIGSPRIPAAFPRAASQ